MRRASGARDQRTARNRAARVTLPRMLPTPARHAGVSEIYRIGGAQVLSWVFGGVSLFALLLMWPSMVPFTVGALGCAALLGMGNGAVFKLVPELFPSSTAAVTGLVGALGRRIASEVLVDFRWQCRRIRIVNIKKTLESSVFGFLAVWKFLQYFAIHAFGFLGVTELALTVCREQHRFSAAFFRQLGLKLFVIG